MDDADKKALIEACLDDKQGIGQIIRTFREETGCGLVEGARHVRVILQQLRDENYPRAQLTLAEVSSMWRGAK